MRLNITNPTYTGVFERGYPPRETVPEFYSREFDWMIREDAKGCQFLTRVGDCAGTRPGPRYRFCRQRVL